VISKWADAGISLCAAASIRYSSWPRMTPCPLIGSAEHGFLRDDPVLRWRRPPQEIRAGEAQRNPPFGILLFFCREAGCGDRPDVPLGLRQTGHHLRLIGADDGCGLL
jgi:hypothetical protein